MVHSRAAVAVVVAPGDDPNRYPGDAISDGFNHFAFIPTCWRHQSVGMSPSPAPAPWRPLTTHAPRVKGSLAPETARQGAIGYRVDLSGQLRLMRIDARAIAKAVRRQRAA